METYYTIIKVVANPVVGDSISIGLLVNQGKNYMLKFSDDKKSLAKRLMGEHSSIVEFISKQVSSHITDLNKKRNLEIFPLTTFINSDYIGYLNSYSNGVLQFSEPNYIDDVITPAKFNKLFSVLIDENHERHQSMKQKSNNQRFQRVINDHLITRVKNRIHTKLNITNSIIPSLFFDYEMDCIGRNGSLIGAKALDFNLTTETLDKKISHYMSLITLLENRFPAIKKGAKNHFYLIADEPSTGSEEHDIYQRIRSNPLFKVVSSNQVEEIAEKVEQSKAEKFLTPISKVA